jgi:RNA-binding protein NOB1
MASFTSLVDSEAGFVAGALPSSSPAAAKVTARPSPGGPDDGTNAVYRSLVVDSGPLIRLSGATELWKRAATFYTVPAVLGEIRDAKAREHVKNLPFDLQVREASPEGIRAVSEFAQLTGDYHSLSSVDLQVLGLLYDLEREACRGNVSHVRTCPKRMIGLGPIATLGGGGSGSSTSAKEPPLGSFQGGDNQAPPKSLYESEGEDGEFSVDGESAEEDEASTHSEMLEDQLEKKDGSALATRKPKSWAQAVNPAARSVSDAPPGSLEPSDDVDSWVTSRFGRINLWARATPGVGNDLGGGQFSDAEEDEDSDNCPDIDTGAERDVEGELELDFPSLAAASTVPYCYDDDKPGGHDEKADNEDPTERLRRRQQAEEDRKNQSLRPVSKSGKLYNSFRNYGDLMKPRPSRIGELSAESPVSSPTENADALPIAHIPEAHVDKNQSRIMGGTAVAGQEDDFEDDGEGWITSTAEIWAKKAGGSLDPSKSRSLSLAKPRTVSGPPAHERSACATTDFAMQNVILQMNLELLSVDGVRVRKLKSFVTRCGACYKVYTSSQGTGPHGKRLFCDKCGSDMMQRIAASVDGRTGRIRLHLSKRYKHNLRGTKFSLPKPGTGDRFKGDLLLREDQLLMGAWNQKVKMASGGKSRSSAQSMFGKDLASNMGCNAKAVDDDIRVGFGRRNPNAARGRERRGKRKKTSDKACGLRRY